MEETAVITAQQFLTSIKPTWCPGCGNFGIWMALKNALTQVHAKLENIVIVYGVGCHGNMRDWMNIYSVEGLHGRAIPVAQGLKLANPELTVVVVAGDGDSMGEGGNHFIHAARRNPDITVIVHDNQVYGLTTGQAAPTAKPGLKTKSTPEGVTDSPMNPLALSILMGGTFAARGFSGDMAHLTDMMAQGILHKGFSVVDVLQPCVTFNKVNTYQWYRERIRKLDANYQVTDKTGALLASQEWAEHIPIGVFYREERPTSEDREYALATGPLVSETLSSPDISGILSMYR